MIADSLHEIALDNLYECAIPTGWKILLILL